MNIFISWSGDSSREIANFLHGWLPSVLQSIKPYMSTENIEKGERWGQNIANELQDAQFGVVCVTPDNLNAPWLLFESGALSKSIGQSRVSPIIFGLRESDLTKSPLLQFQYTRFNREDMQKLVISINNAAPEIERIAPDPLARSFARAWTELDEAIGAVKFSGAVQKLTEHVEDKASNDRYVESLEEILSNSRALLKLILNREDHHVSSIEPDSNVWTIISESIFMIQSHLGNSAGITGNDPVNIALRKETDRLVTAIEYIYSELFSHRSLRLDQDTRPRFLKRDT
jgi:hypothetical protein